LNNISVSREALERCNLSTDNVPKPVEKSSSSIPSQQPSTSTSKWPTPEDLWDDLQMRDTLRRPQAKRPFFTGRALLQNLVKNRSTAIERCKNFQRTEEMLEDEIEFLKQETGASDIIWAVNWDQSSLRRCIANVQQLMKADKNAKKLIMNALNGHELM
jgi:hypothetical protein